MEEMQAELPYGRFRRRLRAIAITNLILGAGFLLPGAALSVMGSTALPRYLTDGVVDLAPMPKDAVLFDRLAGAAYVVRGALLVAGAIGILLKANWGRLATMAYAVLSVVGSTALLIADVLFIGPARAPWQVHAQEAVFAVRGWHLPDWSPMQAVMGGLCCGYPYVIYSVFLYMTLHSPPARAIFGLPGDVPAETGEPGSSA